MLQLYCCGFLFCANNTVDFFVVSVRRTGQTRVAVHFNCVEHRGPSLGLVAETADLYPHIRTLSDDDLHRCFLTSNIQNTLLSKMQGSWPDLKIMRTVGLADT